MTNKTAAYLIWQELFIKNDLNKKGTIIEIAPGHEPKIGMALKAINFQGSIILVEPDTKMADCIYKIYKRLLPKTKIRILKKYLETIKTNDIPTNITAVVASHPFDDIVIAKLIDNPLFFSEERKNKTKLSSTINEQYKNLSKLDYKKAIDKTIRDWKKFIEISKPKYLIASQYPSQTLIRKNLKLRQQSGFEVLKELKKIYKDSLIRKQINKKFGDKAKIKWWIIAKNPNNKAKSC